MERHRHQWYFQLRRIIGHRQRIILSYDNCFEVAIIITKVEQTEPKG